MSLHFSFQILGTTNLDSTPSVLINIKGNKFLFGMGEGITRFCNNIKAGIPDVKHFYWTSLEISSISCVPGLSLFLEQANSMDYSVHGPEGLLAFYCAEELFLCRNYPKINITEYSESDEFEKCYLKQKDVDIYLWCWLL